MGLRDETRVDFRSLLRRVRMCRWRGAWRHFPLLVSHLPHILLGGTMQGIDLHSDVFEERLPQKKAAASGAMAASGTIKASRDCCWERRKQRCLD